MLEPKIILPEKIFILKSRAGCDIIYDREEYSIYYKNIIHPYSEDYDIQIDCSYGKNLDNCWRLDSSDTDTDVFDLTVMVYNEYGELLAEKGCEVELLDKKKHINNLQKKLIDKAYEKELKQFKIYSQNNLIFTEKVYTIV